LTLFILMNQDSHYHHQFHMLIKILVKQLKSGIPSQTIDNNERKSINKIFKKNIFLGCKIHRLGAAKIHRLGDANSLIGMYNLSH